MEYKLKWIEFSKCRSQHWMETEYDDNVIEIWKIPYGNLNKEI